MRLLTSGPNPAERVYEYRADVFLISEPGGGSSRRPTRENFKIEGKNAHSFSTYRTEYRRNAPYYCLPQRLK